MSISSPRRNRGLPVAIQQTLDKMFARGSGFSGPQILDFFSQYSNSIESYPWSGGAPSRWLIFEDCLAQFDFDQQKKIIRDLLDYNGPMSHGRPAIDEVEQIRSWLGDSLPPLTFASKVVEPLNWGYINRTWSKAQERITSGRPRLFRTTRKESFRHNSPLKGEGGRRETNTIQRRADCGGAQAGGMGAPVSDLIRHLGIAEQTFYRWKQRYAGLESEQVREFKQLQDETAKLKRLVADLSLDKVMLQDVLSKKF